MEGDTQTSSQENKHQCLKRICACRILNLVLLPLVVRAGTVFLPGLVCFQEAHHGEARWILAAAAEVDGRVGIRSKPAS